MMPGLIFPFSMTTTRILFLCLGNICRSPAAEGIFIHRARERGVLDRFEVDSAGLGSWHAGDRPDPRTLAEAARRGIPLPGVARQVTARDFDHHHLIVYMDAQNRAGLERRGAPADRLRAMASFAAGPGPDDVADPYEHGPEAFASMFDHLERAVDGMLDELTGPRPDGRARATPPGA
jgi:protein-tyrosine phosphatase